MAHPLNPREAAAVIGGLNMDIWGRPDAALTLRDSNPGSVRMTPGGVGRNIAHNLSLLGLPVSLVAALGDDLIGRALSEACLALGLDLSHARILPGAHSSTYLFVTGADGDMAVAISDMDVCEALTPEYLEAQLPWLQRFRAVVLDANLTEESLDLLCRACRAPLYADTVSAAKAPRLLPRLGALRALKTNLLEAEVLTGLSDPARAAEALVRSGADRVFVSLGAEGMIAAERGRCLHLPVYDTAVVNTTGAGDAAAAAIVWADLLGLELEAAAQCAQLAGSITCRSEQANSPELAALPRLVLG